MKFKFIFFSCFILSLLSSYKAQVVLNQNQNSNITVTAKQSIRITSGFKVKATPGTFFHAFIDAIGDGRPPQNTENPGDNSYGLLTWSKYVGAILNNHCNYGITIIEQNLFYPLTSKEECFTYDLAGNYTDYGFCPGGVRPLNSTDLGQDEEWKIINNNIKVYPIPTSSVIYISWNESVANLVSQMKIVSLNSGYEINIPTNAYNYYSETNLAYQPKGIYYLVITTKSGKTFSKSIIKL